MMQLLILADDFTGALDTAVHFAQRGAATRVVDAATLPPLPEEGVQVLVLNTETRRMTPQQAGETVHTLVRQAVQAGVPYLYKKTDSVLRGNLGAELAAFLQASGGQELAFVPAYPALGRTTQGGVQYAFGVPVAETALGRDSFHPLASSSVAEILRGQTSLPVVLNTDPLPEAHGGPAIRVYDAGSEQEIARLAQHLHRAGALRRVAGCGGLAAEMAPLLGLEGEVRQPGLEGSHLVVVCGTLNEVSHRQCEHAGATMPLYRLTAQQKLQAGWHRTPACASLVHRLCAASKAAPLAVLTTNSQTHSDDALPLARSMGLKDGAMRSCIIENLSGVLAQLYQQDPRCLAVVMGGDMLLGFMRRVGVQMLQPVCQLLPGVVLSSFTLDGEERYIISKSGGFGGDSLFLDLAKLIHTKEADENGK